MSTFHHSGDSDPLDEYSETKGLPDALGDSGNLKKIGRYQIIHQLGRGGFGNVYLAQDPTLKRQVAVKVPRWDKVLKQSELDRFLNEGQMLAQVDHPSVVSVFDVDQDGEIPFVVMQFVEGVSLGEKLKETKPDDSQIVEYLINIGEALQAAHQSLLVHRDFKPSNVIVKDTGQIQLVDFGLALHDDLLPGNDDEIAGTPKYMSPEQIKGENHLIAGQTDIWAFGVTMYKMLTHQMPFNAELRHELSNIICYKSPRPLRQIRSSIPKELERICLRCMEKLISDRYQSMADVLEELRHYQVESTHNARSRKLAESASQILDTPAEQIVSLPANSDSGSNSKNSGSNSKNSATNSKNSATNSTQVNELRLRDFVPKGLRTFDEHDNDFFLSLVPGPIDRNAIPESIRFWKSRVESNSKFDEVSVGLIYGPSGSGKSSFVRAGLIPQLATNIIPIYVNCTTSNLTKHISEKISRVIDAIPRKLPLVEILRRIRNGEFLREGDKLLLVLDQFEQWLHTTKNYLDSELTEALRQCSASSAQVILLIRDDFWLSASEFLNFLEQRIDENQNAMALPLFDKRHARKILEAYGRKLGCLPETGNLSKQQSNFIKTAVDMIASRESVLCVRLVVFAETMKSRPWNVSELTQLGGWEGVGQEFITSIFRNAPGAISKNSLSCWAILRPLLPELETNIKGQGLTLPELRNASELGQQRGAFEYLSDFLIGDAKLITPIENSDFNDSSVQENPTYGLTHDFLVQPIRLWGESKQMETKAGQRELNFRRLATHWSSSREDRFLPGIFDFVGFCRFVSKSTKQEHREYWQLSTKKSLLTMIIAGVFFLALVSGGYFIVDKAIDVSVHQQLELYLNSDGSAGIQIGDGIKGHKKKIKDQLLLELKSPDFKRKTKAILFKLTYFPGSEECASEVDFLLDHIKDYSLVDFEQVLKALLANKEVSSTEIKEKFKLVESRLTRVRLAVELAYLGDQSLLEECTSISSDPGDRTEFIDDFRNWHGDIQTILQDLDPTDLNSGDLISAVMSGISSFQYSSLSTQQRTEIISFTEKAIRSPHAGTHGVARFLNEQFSLGITENKVLVPDGSQWERVFVKSGKKALSFEMVLINQQLSKEFSANTIDEFYIGSCEVSASLFAEFKKTDSRVGEQPKAKRYPATGVSWLECGKFCNWLNSQFPVLVSNYDNDSHQFDENKAGFRLPTFEEHQIATYCNSSTPFPWGENPRFANKYSALGNLEIQPARSYMPNGFGLFDLISNAAEWSKTQTSQKFRILNGGSSRSNIGDVLAGKKSQRIITLKNPEYGIRLVIKKSHLSKLLKK